MDTFKELGTEGAIAKLYETSGFERCLNPYFSCEGGTAVTASRMLLEGIDFDLTYFPFKHLGWKAVVAVTGELYSCMAQPKVMKVVIGVSSKLDYAEISQIWEGFCGAAHEYGYQSLALELEPSLTGLSMSVTATGLDTLEASQRPEAKSMDLICLSNNAGAAFLGEQILRNAASLDEKARGKKLEKYKQLVGAYLKPELSSGTLSALQDSGIVPSYAYFCTKGLQAALRSLCQASGLGAKVYVDKLPFAGGSIDAAKELGVDPLQAALKGGDDNCLLFTIPIGEHEKFRHDFQSWDVIGHLAKTEVGTVVVSPDGLEHTI